jgi:hypothetical protein
MALGHAISLEIAPVLPNAAPHAIVVNIPFRACRHGSAVRENWGCGEEKHDEGTGEHEFRITEHTGAFPSAVSSPRGRQFCD